MAHVRIEIQRNGIQLRRQAGQHQYSNTKRVCVCSVCGVKQGIEDAQVIKTLVQEGKDKLKRFKSTALLQVCKPAWAHIGARNQEANEHLFGILYLLMFLNVRYRTVCMQ